MNQQKALLRLADLFQEAATILRTLAESSEKKESPIEAEAEAATDAAPDPEKASPAVSEPASQTRALLARRGVEVLRTTEIEEEERGLLTLARLMAQWHSAIKPLLQQIKRAQSSRQRVHLNLQHHSEAEIHAITQVATLAERAGLLPNYRYLRSPTRQLFCDAPISPLAINFFTGRWLELFAFGVVRKLEQRLGKPFDPLLDAHVRLPNGDQFDLDLVFAWQGRLIWIEAKTTNDFSLLLPKYQSISKLLCRERDDAILLWSNFDPEDEMMRARGQQARMRLCDPGSFERCLEERLLLVSMPDGTL